MGRWTARFSFVLLIVFSFLTLNAQQKGDLCTIKGKIYDEKSNKPLFGVVATIPELNSWYLSDEKGYFILEGLPAGKVTVHFQRLGLKDKQLELDLKQGEIKEINVGMIFLSLEIDEVVITAKENTNKLSTTSVIGMQAIEHIQASSLGDIMQLLPGQVSGNPDLNSSNQATLRNISTDPNEEKIDALGVSVVMDGAPISNNANLQVTNTAEIGAEGYFSTVSGGGVDLRQIPTDNIESVEVIRGIPSVQYGDLTSGAIIVNTKAGFTPFIVKSKINPNTKQAYIGKGLNFKNNLGSFNVDFDYAYSQADVRMSYPSYDRINGKLTYSNSFFDRKLFSTTAITVFRTYDKDRDKDATSLEKRYSEDIGIRFTTKGKLRLKKLLSDCINYNFTIDSKKQESYNRALISGSITPYAFSETDSTYTTTYLPSEYYSAFIIEGKPLNIFAKIDNRFHKKIGNINNRIMFGINWTMDVNHGNGKYFEDGYYPSSSQRPDCFKDIPAMHQVSFFIEDKIHTKLFGKDLNIMAGLRFDNIQPETLFRGKYGQVLEPRINLSYDLLSNMSIHAGYGKTSKAPSLIYLFPDPAYIDASSFNMYSGDYPDESLAIITTKVYEPDYSNIKPSEMVKFEFGVNYSYKKNSLNITYFNDDLKNGYSFSDVLAVVPYPEYEIFSYTPGMGQQPVLDYTNVDTTILRNTYKIPVNSKNILRQGIEFTLNTAKIASIGTSLNISGAWSKSETSNDIDNIYLNSRYLPGNDDDLIGLYRSNGSKSERLTTTIRIIQHVPQLRFIASLAIQTQWIQKSETIVNKIYPIGYIDNKGNTFYLSDEEAHSEEYSFLVRSFDDTYFYISDKPALWHMSLKLTKEMKNNMSFSFYANNMFMSHPSYKNPKTGKIEKRNSSLFFGVELNFKL